MGATQSKGHLGARDCALLLLLLPFPNPAYYQPKPMTAPASASAPAHVASLHLHPAEPGTPLQPVEAVNLVEAKGIEGDLRHFGRLSGDTGQPSRRQVSLIERELITGHAAALGMTSIPPGAVRSNIETTGIEWVPLLGREVQIGDAILFLTVHRDPCAKMDAICQGLRARMLDRRQGVLAEVRRSGRIRVGDSIRVLP
jgi:MOSC domain-containing protein YiiM